MNAKRYNNYHRHDYYSNIRTPDVIVSPEDYMKRAVELGHTTFFTTNHGCSSNVLEAYGLCKKYGLKLIHGIEMYYADNRLIKESRNNSHIVVIGLTKNAYKHINRISSEANKTGFYYHPRVDMELLLSLPPKEVVVTTACIAGRLFKTDNYIEEFVLPLKEHFGDNFMLETQDHNHEKQIAWNKKIIKLSEEYNIPLIHGCDSHYILPEDAKYRALFLKGKRINYGDEDSFVLDYPSYENIVDNYKKQGILNNEQIISALDNTLIFDIAEDLKFTNDTKMPTIYPNQNKDKVLRKIIKKNWDKEKHNINKTLHDKYKKEIYYEMDIVEKTNTADYFLLNERIIDRAINKYGATLTKSGRGSSPSFYINKLLGFTDIDRINAPVPLYPTRFMSVARILESNQMPDIDFNFANIDPVIKASKDILGEDGVYYMSAFGTMQESAAFRNMCRGLELDPQSYNEIAKNLDDYRNDKKWGKIIEDSRKFVGVIDSIAPSPCSFLLLNQPICEEIGLIKVGDEICAYIDGSTADKWGYLKNDYLTVSVWKLISETFKLIDKPIPTIRELEELLDDNVWDLYAKGITSTLNQADSDFATTLIKRYKPKNISEMSAFVAAIRPGFASLLEHFINREGYTTHIEELDNVLQDSFHYLLYQESIMKMLIWCGIQEDKTYDIIKKIAKKVFDENELAEFKLTLKKGFIANTGSDEWFDEIWQVIEDAVRYSFNASHSVSVAYDSLYGAYLKANYPIEYYKVALDHYKNDEKRTTRLISELDYFNLSLKGIKFRNSKGEHTINKEENAIYKGIASIKYLSENLADELYDLRNNDYPTFLDLLLDIKKKTSCNSRQLTILIKLDFFSEFGGAKKLLQIVELQDYLTKNCMAIKKVEDTPFTIEQFEKYSARKTAKTYMEVDFISMIAEQVSKIPDEDLSIKEKADAQLENLGYIDLKLGIDGQNCYITSINSKFTPKIKAVSLNRGNTIDFKMKKNYLALLKLEVGDLIYIHSVEKRQSWKPDGFKKNGKMKFVKIEGKFDLYITNCEKINENQLYMDRSDSCI